MNNKKDANKILNDSKREKKIIKSITLEPWVFEEALEVAKENEVSVSFLINLSIKLFLHPELLEDSNKTKKEGGEGKNKK